MNDTPERQTPWHARRIMCGNTIRIPSLVGPGNTLATAQAEASTRIKIRHATDALALIPGTYTCDNRFMYVLTEADRERKRETRKQQNRQRKVGRRTARASRRGNR